MRRALLTFFVLAYAITWLGVSPLVAAAVGVVGPVPAWWHAFGALGPIVAALLASPGAAARRELLRSAFGRRPAWLWLAVAVGSPVALLLLAGLALGLFGVERLAWDRLAEAAARPAWWAQLAIAAVLYGFGEEVGWRGFALPRLQRALPAWAATLVLGAIWALWHAPMFVYRFDFGGVGTVVGFFVSLLAGAFWLTFLYNSTGGSVLAVALWHVVWNVVNLVAAELGAPLVVGLNVGVMVLGYGVLVVGPRDLSLSGARVRFGAPSPTA